MPSIRARTVPAFALFLLCSWLAPEAEAKQQRLLTEEFRLHRDFRSKYLPKGRDLVVWLPPGYDSDPARRYPVLYMHDGGAFSFCGASTR
jgi:enterochelin esterase-like enzyme